FGAPSPEFLAEVAGRLTSPFPLGLMTPVGMVVANPAFATRARWSDFGADRYHGTVIWSWQQAMHAAGLARQLERSDLPAAVRNALREAQARLWDAFHRTSSLATSELWSFSIEGTEEYVATPYAPPWARDADAANAVQLWSTAFLAIRDPRQLTAGFPSAP